MSLGRGVRPVVLMLALGFAGAACTFPSVEYDTSCAVPTSCEKEVNSCSNKAQALQNMCSMKCAGTCVDCEADYDQAVTACVVQCETCSANNGCENATENCKALLGAP